jgi:hypothetical protein
MGGQEFQGHRRARGRRGSSCTASPIGPAAGEIGIHQEPDRQGRVSGRSALPLGESASKPATAPQAQSTKTIRSRRPDPPTTKPRRQSRGRRARGRHSAPWGEILRGWSVGVPESDPGIGPVGSGADRPMIEAVGHRVNRACNRRVHLGAQVRAAIIRNPSADHVSGERATDAVRCGCRDAVGPGTPMAAKATGAWTAAAMSVAAMLMTSGVSRRMQRHRVD